MQLGSIETRTEDLRPASELSDGERALIAVQHETGIEIILIPIIVGAVSAILADSVTGFIKWSWKRWQSVRQQRKEDPASLVIAVPRSNAPPLRLILAPPVSTKELKRYFTACRRIVRGC
jgi:hypothetical protein